METFTSTGTWTAPPLLDLQSVNHVQVILCGGGGGGVANQFQFSSGSGGGGVLAVLPVTPGETYTINIGAAGTSSPSDGGDTFFAASNGAVLAVAYGGGAGTAGRGGSGGPVARNVAVVAGQTAPGVSTPGAASALCATYAPRGSGAGGGFNANGGPGWAAVIW
ncbi:glycine-rich domain-containing protein [Andreprevotia chitinilytica]|uniref:glycine-rich domain-containing protein n=1 Tax=Andreprevotia chitinilytica TaxID=396808 RepID=UPI00357147BB